ncbi:MAG: DNA polymerase I [Clostridiales bacterium]|nr:DNA polymerase I [Clostridiales bacterium]
MNQRKISSVMLVDGYSLIFRAFHALPLLTSPDGVYTNAVHGFFSMLLRALSDFRPDALCVMLDVHAPTFRHTLYEDYKGTRKPMPEELRPQLPLLREILGAMHIRTFELEGYEADDLLGTASRLANEQGISAYILTGDRDSLQLVGGLTQVILTKTGVSESLLLDAQGVKDTYGYTPEQVPDMKGLMGDSSDNIPGIAGVGEKTALKLITQYGTLDNVLAHADEVKGKLGEKLRAGKEVALLSRDLGTIRRTAPITPDFAECTWQEMNAGVPLLTQYGLIQTSKNVEQLLSGGSVSSAAAPRGTAASRRAAGKGAPASKGTAAAPMTTEDDAALPKAPAIAAETVYTDTALLRQAAQALADSDTPWAVLCPHTDAFTLLTPAMELWRMPIVVDLMGGGLYPDQILAALSPVLERVPLILHGAKTLMHELARYRLPLPQVCWDTMLAAYLLHTAQKDYSLKLSLAAEYGLDESDVPSAPGAYELYGMYIRQKERIQLRGMNDLLLQMELPLTRVLFDIEREGFYVDAQVLDDLSQLFTEEIEQCRSNFLTFTNAPEGFNLNSPRQLGELLFDKLGLPAPKKTKTGSYTTTAEVLEGLAPYHPAIEPLLRYRKLTKLQSTYVDGLRKLRGKDGRVHTTFDQTAAVTGRISSLEPNLQNIPIRTEEGREIRRAFVAGEGNILLDADYSQIELRVLAHLSGDEAMCDAFQKDQDIHTRTAAEIHGVSMEEVTADMRRAAKATNFGIVYGISGFGLARNAGITRKDADHFIQTYFQRYPGVRVFMDESVQQGYQKGYAQTMFGRRRELYELRSDNRNVRNFGERAAMNTPVQGTAADIIKLAMVRVSQRLAQEGYQARLILQVHDELVVECPISEADAVAKLLKETMESVVSLRVPLVAEVSSGKDWDAAH